MKLLDPIILAQLGNLEIRARRLLDGLYSGRHLNRNRGTSKEFSDHRPYNPGDDLRTLDWKVFGRTDRLVLKQYDEETSMAGVVVLDDSASMGFKSDKNISKLEYAETMAAAIGTLLISQHDAVGLVSSKKVLPLRGHQSALEPFYRQLESLHPEGVWNWLDIPDRVGALLKKRGLLVVFSDLMHDYEGLTSTLRALHSRRHDVMVIQILDPAEMDMNYDGTLLFEDSETQELIKTEPAAIRQAYREFVKEKIRSYAQFFQSLEMYFLSLTTDTPFDRGLAAYLSWRDTHL